MKCISLWEPWASLMVLKLKRNETRSWKTDYRGPLLIHAARKWTKGQEQTCAHWPFCNFVPGLVPFLETRGHIIGKVDLVDIITTEEWCKDKELYTYAGDSSLQVDKREFMFGDYTEGRFAWKTTNAIRFKNPVPYRGRQRLFNVADEKIEGVV